jgi:hypothetical protein
MSYHRPIAHAATVTPPDRPIVRDAAASPAGHPKLSPRTRLAIIGGLAVGLWLPILLAARAILG